MLPGTPKRYPLVLLSSIHKRRYKKNSTLRLQKIPGDVLCIVTQGKGMLRIDDQVLQITPNQAFFLTPQMAVEVLLDSDMAEYYMLVLSSVTISKHKGSWSTHAEQTSLLPYGKIQLKNAKQKLDRVKQLHEESKARSKSPSELQMLFQSLIYLVLQDLPEQDELEEESKGIDQSISYMHKHFTNKIKLDALSDIAGLTPTSYSRSFKKAMGVSPVEYLNHVRIESSKQLLQQPDCSIKEISDSVGFGNEFYFSRMFKRTVGISPTVYVKRRELKVAVASCFRYENNLRSLGIEPLVEMNRYTYRNCTDEQNKRFMEAQLDEMRQAHPDLIIADYRHLPFQEQLKQIAPTVILDFSYDWRVNHMKIAELVGREKEAEQNFSQLELKVKYARNILAQTIGEETVSFIRLYSTIIRVQGLVDHPLNELLYNELGLRPGSCVPLGERNRQFALGSLPPFETDFLYMYKHLPLAEEVELFAEVQKTTSWSGMKAVRNNQTREVPNWVGMSWTPIGQHQIIDELLKWKA
ncbi:helix-turn-helix domain-containing protein [Paenibacillus radicis (ex Xue et al. 2023)]|uniref:Helix-turn-helix domain-containing protein n=1 Tax=Paenibacillus radicis (ex Xue et al. 2023) TaxID=2972489 RepID=A0ABT1YHF5_9BACL|nr:helix-turn-helix domain-containing protein [Paenibacillus radicis (ex Xue et al. 2023)]MCR8632629.1 helix-turn-helix domain-containing protein [Paenibacillus radicis (ex Xue et al. 2023)]